MSVTSAKDDEPFVKIMFDGVVAVGPGRPPGGGTVRGPFFGVMARSTRRLSERTHRLRREKKAAVAAGLSRQSEPDEDPYFVHMHVPTIFTRLVPAKDSRPPDQVLQLSPFHERWFLWHPFRERLEFRIDDDGTLGDLEYPKDESRSFSFGSRHGKYLQEDELSFRGIEHVPDMREIFPARSVLRDGLLSSDPEVDQRVMTQVFVPRGKVIAAGVLKKGKPRKVVFEPRQQLDKQDVLPSAAVVVPGRKVEIVTYSLDSGEPLDSIKFDTAEGGEIWVSNGDPSDVEIDMEQLSEQIVNRMLEDKDWKPSRDAEGYFRRLAAALGQEFNVEFATQVANFHHEHHHQIHSQLVRTARRTGDFDLDFELFYTLMKDKRTSQDDTGLPVPKVDSGEEQGGPDCYPCVCQTNDYLELKSSLGPMK